MKGRDRNAPCWCGSAKKYKKCHLDRDGQAKDNPWAAVDVNRQAFTKKKCCAYDVGLGPCDGGVIKAHTVSSGPNLSKIAIDGHLLHYTASIPEMNQNGGKLSVKKIGIKDASVFHGFCGKHDREIFSCIENECFAGLPDQCLAVAYRTMCRELYGKDAGAHLRETLRGADKGLKPAEQVMFQKMLDEINTGNEAARRELKVTHEALTRALVEKRPNVIKSLIFEFATPLPFMFAGAWSPFTDLYGNELQDGYADEFLEQVFVSSFAGTPCAMICISWRDIEGAPGKIIAEQVKVLPDDQQASACLQFVMKHVENIFFNPDWFQDLNDKQREQLNQLAADGVDSMGSVPSIPVRLEVDFGLPTALRSFQV
jgi:SEC-C motif